MRPTTRLRALLALLLTLSIVAASCGGDDDDETGADGAEETEDSEESGEEADTEDEGAAPSEEDEVAAGDGEPIKIGLLTSFNGPFAPWGVQVRDGMALAVDEINNDGGVDGRPIEIVEVDDQSNAEEGADGFERLVEDGVIAVGGTISSDVGLATSLLAEELQVPLFLVKAGAADILTPDSRYTFRTCLPAAPMVAGPIVQYAQSEGLTSVGAIIADYGWGQSVKASLEDAFAEADGIDLQVEVAPVQEQDFTTYLRSLEGVSPELIVATGHPPGSGGVTVQSSDLGFDVPITGAYSPLAAIYGQVGDDAIGRYADFGCADYDSEDYQELARRYLEISDNTFMEDDAVAGYNIVHMVAEAVAEVGDDPTAVSEYLHGNTFDLPGYSFEMGWTEWGELASAQPLFVVIGEGPAPEGVSEAGEWYPEALILPEPLEPYEP